MAPLGAVIHRFDFIIIIIIIIIIIVIIIIIIIIITISAITFCADLNHNFSSGY